MGMKKFAAGLAVAGGLTLGGLVGFAGPAFAYGGGTTNSGGGDGSALAVQPASPAPIASASSGTTASSSGTTGSLAFTGADIAGTTTVGLALIGGGVVAVRVSRRRHSKA